MQPSTQEEILEFLNSNPGATASELSIHLQVTRANIHYHIKNLLAQDVIETTSRTASKPGPGRPARGYQRSRKIHYDFLAGLLEAILSLNDDLLGSSQITGIANYFSSSFLRPQSSSLRVLADNVVKFLASMNYHPHWEAGQGGPKVYFNNCPFAILLPKYPLLCQMDNLFLSELFGMPVETIQSKSQLSGNIQKCAFQISQNKNPPLTAN